MSEMIKTLKPMIYFKNIRLTINDKNDQTKHSLKILFTIFFIKMQIYIDTHIKIIVQLMKAGWPKRLENISLYIFWYF